MRTASSGAHGQAFLEDDQGFLASDGKHGDLAALGLPKTEGRLQRVLVVGADDEVQPVLNDRVGFMVDPDLRFRVRDAFDENENVHGLLLRRRGHVPI